MAEQKLIAGTTQLDLIGNISIPLDFKIAEIRDILKRDGNTSKRIKLPGTKTNNKFFGGSFDITADYSKFNPNIKTPCKFILDGDEIINGFLQLEKIDTNDKGDVQYNVILFDNSTELFQIIKNRFVKDLDYSDLDHVFSRDNIKNSWDTDWNKNHLGVEGASPGDNGGYFYPLMNDDNNPKGVRTFRPSIYHKRILDKIIGEAGFKWEGSLKDSPRYEREVVPFNGDENKTITETDANAKRFNVGRGSDIIVATNTASTGALPAYFNFLVALDDESTPPFDDSNGLWAIDTFTATSSAIYELGAAVNVDIEVDYDTLPVLGASTRQLEHNLFIVVEVRNTLGQLINPLNNNTEGYQIPFNSGSNPNNGYSNGIQPGNVSNVLPAENGPSSGNVVNMAVTLPFVNSTVQGAEQNGNVFIGVGWEVKMFLKIKSYSVSFFGGVSGTSSTLVNSVKFIVKAGSSFRSKKIKVVYTEGDLLDLTDFVDPNLKQTDVIKDIAARYNCFIYTDPDHEDIIRFEIRDIFYANGPIVDWTEKEDRNSKREIKPAGSLQSEEFIFSFKKGSDDFNKIYTEKTRGETYGQHRHKFVNDFVKGVTKIETPFESTPMIRVNNPIEQMIVPHMFSESPKTGPRVLYAKKGLFTGDISADGSGVTAQFAFQYRDVNGIVQLEPIIGYPYAGHYSVPIPTGAAGEFDINFGTTKFLLHKLPNDFLPPADNAFETYWSNTMLQISEGKILKNKFNLSPRDMYEVRQNPNTKVYIENTLYYINIINYEGNQKLRKTALVELVTVEDALTTKTGSVVVGVDYEGSFEDSYRPLINEKINPPNNTNIRGENVINAKIDGTGNNVGGDSENIVISGNDNRTGPGLENIKIENSDGVGVMANNVVVINHDNITITENDLTLIGDTLTINGKSEILFNKIEGGLDEVRGRNSVSQINKFDGGADKVEGLFNESLFNKIETEDGITDKI